MGGSKQISGRERRPEQHNRHGKLEMQLKQDSAGMGTSSHGGKGVPAGEAVNTRFYRSCQLPCG